MKAEPYDSFRQRIHKAAEEKNLLLRAMFELTYRCNFRCGHCYVPVGYKRKYGNKELKTEEIFSILDQLRDLGCFYLGLTGGEPFLRKDIVKVLRYAKDKGFEIIIYTNGSLIDSEMAGELKAINPNKVDITIPAMSERAFEDITGIAGARARVFRAIELLNERGVNLGFKTCVLKENEAEIEGIRGFSRRLHIGHRLDDAPSPCLDGSKRPYNHRSSALTSLVKSASRDPAKEASCRSSSRNGLFPKTGGGLFGCGSGLTQAAITPCGELKICLMIDYPKYRILEISLKEAWRRLGMLVRSISPDGEYGCDRCGLYDYCDWCPAVSWLENKTFTACSPESRILAKARRGP